jgi:DNA-binding TFAR19-related protein (PDSD5 family)
MTPSIEGRLPSDVRPRASETQRQVGAREAASLAPQRPGTIETPHKVQDRAERIFQAILQRIGRDPEALERLRSLALTTMDRSSEAEGPIVAALTHARVQGMVADLTRRSRLSSVDMTA